MHVCVKSKCEHKSFFPVNAKDIFGVICVMFSSALASAAGIGGGSLLFLPYITIMGFETHEAVPLSKLTVFASSLVTFFMTLNAKHPYRNTFALDYNISGMIIPMVLFGTSLGVVFHKMLPFSIILISLTLVLLLSTFKSFQS